MRVDRDIDPPSMSEFRVAANTIHERRIEPLDSVAMQLPALFTGEEENSSLYAKYMGGGGETLSPIHSRIGNDKTTRHRRVVTYTNMVTVEKTRNEPRAYPNKENTVVLSQLHYSVLTGKRLTGTFYAFLMSTLNGKKKDTNIGVSKNPLFSVIAHNNQAKLPINDAPPTSMGDVYSFPVIYDKDTASAAPFWRLNTVLGPFYTKHAAEECCHEWVRKTRGTVSKQLKAPRLARMFNCDIYSSQVSINMPIERYLYENNAPVDYIRACQSIKSECRSIVSS